MPDFNIDDFKKTWQEQEVQPKYGNSEILDMLNRKSRNYVKYILWISVAEFLLFFAITIYYILNGDDGSSFVRIMERMGVQKTTDVEKNFEHLYFGLKMLSLLVTAFFVVLFYQNYRKINVEANLKKFILQIIRFRKTVNAFIFTNIFLLVAFMGVLTVFVFRTMSSQNIQLDHPNLIGFVTGIIVTLLLSIALIWLYYRVVYGIIVGRLSKNLKQLQEIEEEELESGSF